MILFTIPAILIGSSDVIVYMELITNDRNYLVLIKLRDVQFPDIIYLRETGALYHPQTLQNFHFGISQEYHDHAYTLRPSTFILYIFSASQKSNLAAVRQQRLSNININCSLHSK